MRSPLPFLLLLLCMQPALAAELSGRHTLHTVDEPPRAPNCEMVTRAIFETTRELGPVVFLENGVEGTCEIGLAKNERYFKLASETGEGGVTTYRGTRQQGFSWLSISIVERKSTDGALELEVTETLPSLLDRHQTITLRSSTRPYTPPSMPMAAEEFGRKLQAMKIVPTDFVGVAKYRNSGESELKPLIESLNELECLKDQAQEIERALAQLATQADALREAMSRAKIGNLRLSLRTSPAGDSEPFFGREVGLQESTDSRGNRVAVVSPVLTAMGGLFSPPACVPVKAEVIATQLRAWLASG